MWRGQLYPSQVPNLLSASTSPIQLWESHSRLLPNSRGPGDQVLFLSHTRSGEPREHFMPAGPLEFSTSSSWDGIHLLKINSALSRYLRSWALQLPL